MQFQLSRVLPLMCTHFCVCVCRSLCSYADVMKPILDFVLFSIKMAEMMGSQGPLGVFFSLSLHLLCFSLPTYSLAHAYPCVVCLSLTLSRSLSPLSGMYAWFGVATFISSLILPNYGRLAQKEQELEGVCGYGSSLWVSMCAL